MEVFIFIGFKKSILSFSYTEKARTNAPWEQSYQETQTWLEARIFQYRTISILALLNKKQRFFTKKTSTKFP